MGSRLLSLRNGKKEGMSFPMNSQELQKTNQQTKILILLEKIQRHKALDEIPKFFSNLLPYYYIVKLHPNHQPPKFLIYEEYENLGTHECACEWVTNRSIKGMKS
jgi:hypothetical protein